MNFSSLVNFRCMVTPPKPQTNWWNSSKIDGVDSTWMFSWKFVCGLSLLAHFWLLTTVTCLYIHYIYNLYPFTTFQLDIQPEVDKGSKKYGSTHPPHLGRHFNGLRVTSRDWCIFNEFKIFQYKKTTWKHCNPLSNCCQCIHTIIPFIIMPWNLKLTFFKDFFDGMWNRSQ